MAIPRDEVTLPLGEEWRVSPINVPTPGVIASYRKGQYHLHEMRDEFRVHLDRYDPVHHPILHLVDDAPLLLMISETFITLLSLTRVSALSGIEGKIREQTRITATHILSGLIIILLGGAFVIFPDITFMGITVLVIPGIVCIFGILTLLGGISWHEPEDRDPGMIIRGCGIICLSIVLASIPPQFWAICLLLVIAVWMFATAVFLIRRVIRGRRAVPEGFVSRLLIGFGSLILGVFSLLTPESVFYLFLDILGILTMTLGGALTLLGIRLRRMMQDRQAPPDPVLIPS